MIWLKWKSQTLKKKKKKKKKKKDRVTRSLLCGKEYKKKSEGLAYGIEKDF